MSDAPTAQVDPAFGPVTPPARDRLRRFRSALYIAVAVAVVALVVAPRLRASEPIASEQGPTSSLVVSGPTEIDAGADWVISVAVRDGGPRTDAAMADVAVVEVLVTGPWGVRSLEFAPVDDWTFTVPGELTRRSGVLTATVRAGNAVGSGFVDVRPLEAVDGATPLAGPRSMIADTEHWTMVSAFPRDRFGNAVADGTPVVVHVRRPGGGSERVETVVEHLMSTVRVFSDVVAGRTALRLDTDGATGPEVEVLEVPGPPVSVTLVEPSVPLRADGRMLVTVASDLLTDRHGNVLLDGTVGVVRMDGPLGKGTLRPVTIDGRFEFVVEAPPEPGAMTLDLEVDGVRSDPIVLEFATDVSELPVEAARTDDGVVVRVGEVLSVHGGYVPDGTTAVARTGATEIELDILDGIVEFVVDVDAGEPIEVQVLGSSAMVVAP